MSNATTEATRMRARSQGKARRRAGSAPLATATRKKRAARTARLEARIRPELRALIQRAADLEGRKVTEFVTAALKTAAERAIAESQVLRLAAADQLRFAQALIAPPAPTQALKRAFARRRALIAGS
jgi:uncharacterized protein (DUF1778 family)